MGFRGNFRLGFGDISTWFWGGIFLGVCGHLGVLFGVISAWGLEGIVLDLSWILWGL